MDIKAVISNSQKPYGLAYDVFPLCNIITLVSGINGVGGNFAQNK